MIKTENTNALLNLEDIVKQKEVFGEIEVIKSKEVLTRALNTLPFQIGYYQVNKVLDAELYPNMPFIAEAEIKNVNVYDKPINVKLENVRLL